MRPPVRPTAGQKRRLSVRADIKGSGTSLINGKPGAARHGVMMDEASGGVRGVEGGLNYLCWQASTHSLPSRNKWLLQARHSWLLPPTHEPQEGWHGSHLSAESSRW